MRRVLAIDTAGPIIGAAVVGDGLEDAWSDRAGRGSDAVLTPAIADLLSRHADIDGVAVTVGPGAFTGLRVGVATALGLAMARGLRVVPISSLEARALQAKAPRVLALLDARKQRFYGQLFDTTGALPTPLSEARDAAIGDLLPAPGFVAVGEGAEVAADAVTSAGGRTGSSGSPVVQVGRLALARPESALEPAEIALRYLRMADAKPRVQPG